jgi:hypothetical protein
MSVDPQSIDFAKHLTDAVVEAFDTPAHARPASTAIRTNGDPDAQQGASLFDMYFTAALSGIGPLADPTTAIELALNRACTALNARAAILESVHPPA